MNSPPGRLRSRSERLRKCSSKGLSQRPCAHQGGLPRGPPHLTAPAASLARPPAPAAASSAPVRRRIPPAFRWRRSRDGTAPRWRPGWRRWPRPPRARRAAIRWPRQSGIAARFAVGDGGYLAPDALLEIGALRCRAAVGTRATGRRNRPATGARPRASRGLPSLRWHPSTGCESKSMARIPEALATNRKSTPSTTLTSVHSSIVIIVSNRLYAS